VSRTLAQLLEDVKILSGQHIMDTLELDATKFKVLIEHVVLPMFGKYRPQTLNRNITVSGSSYTFVSDIPEVINRVVPVNAFFNPIAILTTQHVDIDSPSRGLTPLASGWEYRKPVLYTSLSGEMTIRYTAFPALVAIAAPSTDHTITQLDDSDYPLLSMLASGYFMTSIAMTRKIGSIQGLDIAFDADTLLTHANDKLLEALTELKLNSKWWAAL